MIQAILFAALAVSAQGSMVAAQTGEQQSPNQQQNIRDDDVPRVYNCKNVTHRNNIDYMTFGPAYDKELWMETCSFIPRHVTEVDAEVYRFSAYVKLSVDPDVSQKKVVFGFMYNVQSIENYDFILLRSSQFGCLISGYVKDTGTYYYKGGDAMDRGKRCDLAIANNRFFRLEITVSANRHVQMKIDGELVTHEREEWCETLHRGRAGLIGVRSRGHKMAVEQAELIVVKPWGSDHPTNMTYTPLNQVVNVGDSVDFRCGSMAEHDTIKWFRYLTSNGRRILISTNQHFNITRRIGDYTLRPIKPSGSLLKINRARLADAGLYRCVSKEANKEVLAYLTVVHDIVCFSDPEDFSTLEARQKVRLNCTVTYSGRYGPRMQWVTATGKRIRSWTTVNRSEVSSQVEFRYRSSQQSIVILCRVYFSRAHAESPLQGSVLAKNIPTYTYVHPFPALDHDPKAGFGSIRRRVFPANMAAQKTGYNDENDRSSFVTKVVASIFGSAILVVIGIFLAIYWKNIYAFIQRRRGVERREESPSEDNPPAYVHHTATHL